MQFIKLLGQQRAVRDFGQRVAEIQILAAILNSFTARGVFHTVAKIRSR